MEWNQGLRRPIETFGPIIQIDWINLRVFEVFSVKQSTPILALWVSCPFFQHSIVFSLKRLCFLDLLNQNLSQIWYWPKKIWEIAIMSAFALLKERQWSNPQSPWYYTWTISDMVKYRDALRSFLKLTALVFYHVWHSPSHYLYLVLNTQETSHFYWQWFHIFLKEKKKSHKAFQSYLITDQA